MHSILIYGIALLSLTDLIDVTAKHQEINPDNFPDSCEMFDAKLCIFLTPEITTKEDYLSTNESQCVKAIEDNGPCVRLNIKSLDDPCRHEFSVAGINLIGRGYLGVAISKDNQMLADYGFYCTSEKSVAGLIIRRNSEDHKAVFDSSLNWRKNPELIEPSKKVVPSNPSRYFLKCGFKTHRSHKIGGSITDYPDFEVALGIDNGYTILLAHGQKNSTGANLTGPDNHQRHQRTFYALRNELIAKNHPNNCTSSSSSEHGGFFKSFYWFLIFIVTVLT